MPAGMQVFGPDGRLYVDLTYNISQHAGSVDTGGGAGSIALPTLPAGKRYFYYIVALSGTGENKGVYPGVTITGNMMTWQYQFRAWFGRYAQNVRIYYGYY